ncbi:hypothetical protein [Erythrobacter sp. EC-HK427]|uniref:hypothetical protein n=1 Tax=Erythrobacter sp. EC-HK427 TaxID=2038396 RepID=UPI001259FE6F|nr:hypothetical protein [Erythrobacter sp. EC-HK427]VVT12590.1 conserved hypothetical protein [Erythrobacter sp. EC-HK427]
MSIRFAASRTKRSVCMHRELVRMLSLVPANDNGHAVQRNVMDAALRHFAEHGIAAAQNAREQAILAGKAGERELFEYWLEICRALDRRMARQLDPVDSTGRR